jgi:hypothetical protein
VSPRTRKLLGRIALAKAIGLIVTAAVYAWASRGPRSARARYHRLARAALVESRRSGPPPGEVVTEDDLARLPAPLADYVRGSGAVGQPRVVNFRARISGRIRAGADKPWMPFEGEQVNTFGPLPSRLFFIDARMFGLPVDVLHLFTGPSATMEVKACSLVPITNAAGPEMDRSETVTILNDLCVMAPAALVDAQVAWEGVDDHRVRGTFTRGDQTVRAELVFDHDHQLVDFVSDDRSRSSSDGRSFTPQRWSTPLRRHRAFGSRRIASVGEARWHAPEPEGEFAYLEFFVEDIAYDVG